MGLGVPRPYHFGGPGRLCCRGSDSLTNVFTPKTLNQPTSTDKIQIVPRDLPGDGGPDGALLSQGVCTAAAWRLDESLHKDSICPIVRNSCPI